MYSLYAVSSGVCSCVSSISISSSLWTFAHTSLAYIKALHIQTAHMLSNLSESNNIFASKLSGVFHFLNLWVDMQ